MPLKRVNTELRTLLHSFFCPSHTPTRGQLHLQNKHKRLRTNFNWELFLLVTYPSLWPERGPKEVFLDKTVHGGELLCSRAAYWEPVSRICHLHLLALTLVLKQHFFAFTWQQSHCLGFLRVTGHWTGTVHSSHLVVKSGAFEARNAGPVRIPSSSYQQSSSNSSRG